MSSLSRARRKVRRVLLMIEDEGAAQGEVFDLTALVADMHARAPYSANIGVTLYSENDYSQPSGPDRKRPSITHITFSGDAGEWVSGATHLEDVVNFGLPDGERVKDLRAKSKRLKKKAEQLERDAMVAKLVQVAEVRSAHPIARFEVNDLPKLPESTQPAKSE